MVGAAAQLGYGGTLPEAMESKALLQAIQRGRPLLSGRLLGLASSCCGGDEPPQVLLAVRLVTVPCHKAWLNNTHAALYLM